MGKHLPWRRRRRLYAAVGLIALAMALAPLTAPAQYLRSAGGDAPGFERVQVADEDYLFFKSAARWKLSADSEIAVCWEVEGAGWPKEKALVQKVIGETWARYSALTFTGWGSCPDANFVGIRILAANQWPHTKGLGAELSGKRDGMVLNFEYALEGFTPCRQNPLMRELCTRGIAVHEFGHALGFSHEHNRDDRDSDCFKRPQGPDGDAELTPYDPDSVMNYCNPVYNNYGKLSYFDVVGLRTVYGEPRR